jgi:hypothetical protein
LYVNHSQSLFEFLVILNGIQNTAIKYGELFFSGYINTESLDFEFRGVRGNLCKLAVAENLYGDGENGDDEYQDDAYYKTDDEKNDDDIEDENYQDDAYYKNDDDNGDEDYQDDGSYKNDDDNGGEDYQDDGSYKNDDDNGDEDYQDDGSYKNEGDAQCVLEDGVYGFSTEITIPSYESRWSDTGWKATGQVDIYSYGMAQIGSCEASVRLLNPIGPSAKTLFNVILPLIGVVFICILSWFGIRMVLRCNRDLHCSKCKSGSRPCKHSRKDSSKRKTKPQNEGVTTSGTEEPGANTTPAYQLMSEVSADWVGPQNKRDIARLVLV